MVKPSPTLSYRHSALAALTYSRLNLLLVFIPIVSFVQLPSALSFLLSALTILSLSTLLGYGTEQIQLAWGTGGALLNATLGNLVELIIAIVALRHNQLDLIQSSLMGGLLSNLLLVLGLVLFVGGCKYPRQGYEPNVAQLNSSLLGVSVLSLMIPFTMYAYMENRVPKEEEAQVLLAISRSASIVLMLIYVAYMVFQFYTHTHWYSDEEEEDSDSTRTLLASPPAPPPAHHSCEAPPISLPVDNLERSVECDHRELNAPSAFALLVLVTVLVYWMAEELILSLNVLANKYPSISTQFLTIVVLPIISNFSELTAALIFASKGKFDLAMSVAVGSCIQIALFVLPLLVCIAWAMSKPLTLVFDEVQTVVLFFSVLLVKFSVGDGKSHWMSGVILIGAYMLIALAFWNLPDILDLH